MKEKEITITKTVWECETCGTQHEEDGGGKWAIFHCPEHGEFCNDGGQRCGLYRFMEKTNSGKICCPICGWSPFKNYTKEYDLRKGSKPKTVVEKKSFRMEQQFTLKYPQAYSGYMSYKRMISAGAKYDEETKV